MLILLGHIKGHLPEPVLPIQHFKASNIHNQVRKPPIQHLMHHNPERKDIRLLREPPPCGIIDNFRRPIEYGKLGPMLITTDLIVICLPKVNQLTHQSPHDNDVGLLDVQVDDAVLVDESQAL